VIAGKSIPHDGPAKCFGYVQAYDSKPKRRLFEVLASQGMAASQQVTFLTDGADDVRDLPLYLNPGSGHLIDWFHITMRLTVLAQMAKGPAGAGLCTRRGAWCTDLDDDDLRHLGEDVARVPRQLERLKWFLWHGNVFRALQVTSDLESDLEILHDAGPEYARLHKAVREFGGYIAANAWSIPNYGERYRAGEAISTAFTESAVNQVIAKRMVKKQQMRWTPRGAHLLLQVRTGPHPNPQRRPRRRLPPLVPRVHPLPSGARGAGDRRVAPHGFSRSPSRLAVPVIVVILLSW
jgi:hypothetical protein